MFPQAGRRRKAQTEAAAWDVPSDSVSAGRDFPDGDREKLSGFQRHQEALNILRVKVTEIKGIHGWKEGGYTRDVTSPEGTELNSPASLGGSLKTGSSAVYFYRITGSFMLEKTFNITESNLCQSLPRHPALSATGILWTPPGMRNPPPPWTAPSNV